METVKSADGTTIAFDLIGDGPPVIIVCGGSTDRRANASLAEELAKSFAAYNFDRRGRGDSGDTPPYAVEREIEDINAVIAAAGGSAHLYGTSSGAALAMEAAAAGSAINKLALWEPPYIMPPRARPPADTAKIFSDFVDAGKRDEAVEFFMSKVVGLPDEFVSGARQAPFWRSQIDIAHTLAYDATIMGNYEIPADRAKAVAASTLIVDGEASFDFMHEAADALGQLIPTSERRTLPGQTHDVDPTVLAPVLAEFFGG